MSLTGPNRFRTLAAFFIIAAALLLSFHEHAYDNENSRLDLAYSIALNHSLNIDQYYANTIDLAYVNGHYFCDKAPGLSFFAAPFIAAAKHVVPSRFLSPDMPLSRWLLLIPVLMLPSIAAAFIIFKSSGILSGNRDIFPVFVFSVGTLAFPYSTLFYDHQFAGVLLLAAFFLYLLIRNGSMKAGTLAGAAAGLLLGWCAISEYPSAVPAAVLFILLFFSGRSVSFRVSLVATAAIPLAGLAAYNLHAFGGVFNTGYKYEVNSWFREQMSRGIGGVSFPKPLVMLKLLFEPQRGLFWAQPFLLLCIPGAVILWRKGGLHRHACAGMLFFVTYRILLNAGYYEPYGGFSPGPRFLVAALPFMALLAAVAWAELTETSKAVFGGMALFSCIIFAVMNFVEPHVPGVFNSPVFHYILPLVASGYVPRNPILVGVGGVWAVTAVIFIFGTVLLFTGLRPGARFRESVSFGVGFMTVGVLFMASALFINPDTATSEYYLGAQLNRNKQHSLAIEHFYFALEANPNFSPAWYALGISKIKTDQPAEAVSCFAKAFSLDPKNIQNRVSLIAALFTSGRVDDSLALLNSSIASDPGNQTLLNLRNKLNGVISKNERR